MKILICITLLFLSCLASVPAGEKDTDLDRMQGTWIVVSLTEVGKVIPAKETELLEYVISKDMFTVYEKGKVVVQDQIKLDPTKTPKAIDFTHQIGEDKGKTDQAIYVFENDQLKFCVGETVKDRPKVFEGKEYSVLVLKKKEK